MICGQNNTSFSWSYRDSSKRSLGNNVKSRRGKRKIHTLAIGGNVQMAKSDPEAQRKSSLSDCTWLENEYGSFNLETLKFLMYFSKPRSSLYFYFYTYSYFFLFLILIFFLFIIIFFSFSFSSKFFYLLPLNSKITLYLPPPPCLDDCSSSGKEVIKIR
jgi:cellulose synthase/poly-beta-1,6-N-acetylglucosamine synthase-like glycosyltransferase